MGYAKRVDENQPVIVNNLRKIGATVQVLSMVGKGCPDILVGFRNRNFLFELKDGNKTMSRKKLTPDELEFFNKWKGQVNVVENLDEILNIINQ